MAPFRTVAEKTFATATVADRHQVVHNHSNGIIVVGLAESHPLIREGKTVARVHFKGGKRDFTQNVVEGKHKKGGAQLQPNDRLCEVHCTDETVHVLRACVRGKLVEINNRLLTEPNLLVTCPSSAGFLAVIMPTGRDAITGDVGAIQPVLSKRVDELFIEHVESSIRRKRGRAPEARGDEPRRSPVTGAPAGSVEPGEH